MSVHCYEKYPACYGPCKVNVDPLPRLCGPGPGVKWSLCWCLSIDLTICEGISLMFRMFVDGWPPNMTAGQCFHADYSRVAPVKLVEYLCLEFRGDNHGSTP